jgi:hypothetical protein
MRLMTGENASVRTEAVLDVPVAAAGANRRDEGFCN